MNLADTIIGYAYEEQESSSYPIGDLESAFSEYHGSLPEKELWDLFVARENRITSEQALNTVIYETFLEMIERIRSEYDIEVLVTESIQVLKYPSFLPIELIQNTATESFQNMVKKYIQKVLAERSQDMLLDTVQKPRLASQIVSAIEDIPVEDGVCHAAEDLLERAIKEQPSETFHWIEKLLTKGKNPSIAASVIKCLGRLDPELCKSWGINLIKQALKHPDIEVRDVAIQALENWEIEEAIPILEEYRDEVQWLEDYASEVLEGIKASVNK